MTRHHWLFVALPLAAGCAAPGPQQDDLHAQLTKLRAQVRTLEGEIARLEHAETDALFNDAEHEFRTLTIDRAKWSDQPNEQGRSPMPHWKSPALLCHVVEWNGFGRMKRFTALADQEFDVLLEGAPYCRARVAVGGISSDDGATRLVVMHPLRPDDEIPPRGEDTLRARNQNSRYQWVVGPDVAAHRD